MTKLFGRKDIFLELVSAALAAMSLKVQLLTEGLYHITVNGIGNLQIAFR